MFLKCAWVEYVIIKFFFTNLTNLFGEMALLFSQSAAFNVTSQLNNICLCVINQHFHDIFQQLKIISNMIFTAQLIRAKHFRSCNSRESCATWTTATELNTIIDLAYYKFTPLWTKQHNVLKNNCKSTINIFWRGIQWTA